MVFSVWVWDLCWAILVYRPSLRRQVFLCLHQIQVYQYQLLIPVLSLLYPALVPFLGPVLLYRILHRILILFRTLQQVLCLLQQFLPVKLMFPLVGIICCCPDGLPVLLPTGVGCLLGFLLGFLDPRNNCSGSNVPDTGVPLLD